MLCRNIIVPCLMRRNQVIAEFFKQTKKINSCGSTEFPN